MATSCMFLTSPSFETLQSEVFTRVSEQAGDQPTSILYIENNDHRKEAIADAWAASYNPLRLRVVDFTTVVSECYERILGPGLLLDALTRRQLIDRALRIVSNRGLLDNAHRYRDHVTDLITALEGEGYQSPNAVRELVADSPLSSELTDLVMTVYETFSTLRDEELEENVYTLSEAFHTILQSGSSFSELFPHVDVVVVSGFYELSYHEEAFLQQLAQGVSLYISLPLVETEPLTGGANRITADAMETYQELAGSPIVLSPDSSSPLSEIAGQMYTPMSTAAEMTIEPDTLRWHRAPTPDREVRHVARHIRTQLANGVDPNDILVVIPGLISYQERVADVFEAAGIEAVGFANKLLYQTYTGRATLDLVELCLDEPQTDTIARIAANPFVTLGETRSDVDRAAVADLTRRLPSNDPPDLLTELDATTTQALEHLFEIAADAGAAGPEAVVDAVRAVFETVDLDENVRTVGEHATSFDARMERAAYTRVDEVFDAIDVVAEQFGMDDPIEEVYEALETVRVQPPRQATQDVIEIVGPRDAYMQSVSHLYFVGLTESDFPVEQDRPRLFERLFDGLPEITFTDDRDEARYQFATLLSSAESVYITTPEASFDDEDRLESSILDELARVTGLEPTPDPLGNALTEDVQRALRHHNEPDTWEVAVDHAASTGAFDRQQVLWLVKGAECAANRASISRTRHDGHLTPEVVTALHDEREPYSPSQLNDYAQCGFHYYMKRVLGHEAPEEFHLEPQRLDLGTLVHDILERFYRDLQADDGASIRLTDYDRLELEERLLAQTRASLEDAAIAFDDVFYDRWVEQLLAGLATPDVNEYYGNGWPHRGTDQGLLSRFLDAEYDDDGARPAWFEEPLAFADGDGDEGAFAISTPSGREIPLDGVIDRVNIREHDDGTIEGLVHDYKTSDPKTIQTIDGVEFQLPLYTLATHEALIARHGEALETVDSQFYVVDPPTEIKQKWSLQDYLERKGGTSLDYERFLSQTVPSRLEEIVDSIEAGAFHPTTLPASEAGCRYCEYRDICDVRHHQRQERVGEIDQSATPEYVPQRAQQGSFLDSLGGDDE